MSDLDEAIHEIPYKLLFKHLAVYKTFKSYKIYNSLHYSYKVTVDQTLQILIKNVPSTKRLSNVYLESLYQFYLLAIILFGPAQ